MEQKYNVIVSTPVYRTGGMDKYDMRVNREPLTLAEAEAQIQERAEKGISARLEAIGVPA